MQCMLITWCIVRIQVGFFDSVYLTIITCYFGDCVPLFVIYETLLRFLKFTANYKIWKVSLRIILNKKLRQELKSLEQTLTRSIRSIGILDLNNEI